MEVNPNNAIAPWVEACGLSTRNAFDRGSPVKGREEQGRGGEERRGGWIQMDFKGKVRTGQWLTALIDSSSTLSSVLGLVSAQHFGEPPKPSSAGRGHHWRVL